MTRSAVPQPEDPTVLIVGGLFTSPPVYWRFARRLAARTSGRVLVAPTWTHAWVLGVWRGFGALLERTGRAIERAREVGDGRPILVVAHSAGGILTRLAMSPLPFEGRFVGVSETVGGLVTLGTPHLVAAPHGHRHAGVRATAFLEATTPGAWFAPRTSYLTIGSRAVPANPSGSRRARFAARSYASLLGEEGRIAVGDGLVPEALSHLVGARQLTFDDVVHGHIGSPWYGDERIIDRWWPQALEGWREALASRASHASQHVTQGPSRTPPAGGAFDRPGRCG